MVRRSVRHKNNPFRFPSTTWVDFRGARVTSDVGMILVRELDEDLRVSKLIGTDLSYSRRARMSHW